MPKLQSPNARIAVRSGLATAPVLSFELQPLMRVGSEILLGHELLFRGPRSCVWADVDRSLLRHLSETKEGLLTLFVNLANESVLAIPHAEFIAAAGNNDVIFEISETLIDAASFSLIAAKVNELSSAGLKFAIDDFGSGQDGLKRLYSFDSIDVVKIDGAFLHTSMQRPDAAKALRSLISHWKNNAIVTVAECVESADILAFCEVMGVDVVQGWYIDALMEPGLMTA